MDTTRLFRRTVSAATATLGMLRLAIKAKS